MIKTAMEREREMNIPQCHINTYHNMTKIYIHKIHNLKFANMYLFISLIPKIHSQ
jgi:hypothetical protein